MTSEWFDGACFASWYWTLFYCGHQIGIKVLIDDNLSSHFNPVVLQFCQEYEICFICFPLNSTHIMQSLNVAHFAPLQRAWRAVLQNWKKKEGRYSPVSTKKFFPRLLSRLWGTWNWWKTSHRILKVVLVGIHAIILQWFFIIHFFAGFKTCGLHSFDPSQPISRLPYDDEQTANNIVSNRVLTLLESMRGGSAYETSGNIPHQRHRKVHISPGCSVTASHLLDGKHN